MPESNLQHTKHTRHADGKEKQPDADELDGFEARVRDIILDHHLRSQTRVIQNRDNQQDHQYRVQRRGQPSGELRVGCALHLDDRPDEPENEWNVGEGRDFLVQPVFGAVMGGAVPPRLGEGRFETVLFGMHGHNCFPLIRQIGAGPRRGGEDKSEHQDDIVRPHCDLFFQKFPGVPEHMPDAVAHMVVKRGGPEEEDDLAEGAGGQAHDRIIALLPVRGGEKEGGDEDGA